MSARRNVFEQPLDATLLALRTAHLPYRGDERDLKIWRAVCPCCRAPEWGLTIRESYEGGPVTWRCNSGCSDGEIRGALDAATHEIDPYALELAEQARDVAARALDLLVAQVEAEPARVAA